MIRVGTRLIGLLVLAGCFDIPADRRVLLDTPVVLTPTPHIIRPEPRLRAIGPFNELRLDLPSEYRLGSGDHGPNMWRVGRPDGTFVEPMVVLIGPDGQRQPFPFFGFAYVGTRRQICFETRPPRDLERRYVEVQLSADDTLQILGVRWSAGKRFAGI